MRALHEEILTHVRRRLSSLAERLFGRAKNFPLSGFLHEDDHPEVAWICGRIQLQVHVLRKGLSAIHGSDLHQAASNRDVS